MMPGRLTGVGKPAVLPKWVAWVPVVQFGTPQHTVYHRTHLDTKVIQLYSIELLIICIYLSSNPNV